MDFTRVKKLVIRGCYVTLEVLDSETDELLDVSFSRSFYNLCISLGDSMAPNQIVLGCSCECENSITVDDSLSVVTEATGGVQTPLVFSDIADLFNQLKDLRDAC
jgi:hypothetical protein